MPFNGSGTFNRLYSWVQDAANGINIDATRMDNEFNGVATALSDCVTRDGQSPFTANMPAGGFKITGLGTPAASTDAATKGYVDGAVGTEWVAENSGAITFVSATQFKVVGIDVTARYHTGRRVKILHNGGVSTAYATVVSSSFSSDTTVTVATDDGSSLVTTVTAVYYGLLSYVNPSYLDPRSQVFAAVASNITYTASGTVVVAFNADRLDTLSEFDAVTNHRFTAKHGGFYLVVAEIQFQTSAATTPLDVTVTVRQNSVQAFQESFTGAYTGGNGNVVTVRAVDFVSLAKGDTVDVAFQSAVSGFILQAPSGTQGSHVAIGRIA